MHAYLNMCVHTHTHILTNTQMVLAQKIPYYTKHINRHTTKDKRKDILLSYKNKLEYTDTQTDRQTDRKSHTHTPHIHTHKK